MSENKEKDKDIEDLALTDKNFKDLDELLEWMASPRVYWDNFAVTLPVKNNNDIKWIALAVADA
tara:strand:- start:1188 stop:1379 length:192 start_codon:yes stop_codon:yes gene_type:complete